MISIGNYNILTVTKFVEFGLYLDGGEYDEILLPKRYMPNDISIGDKLDVFIYTDSEDRFIATTETPKTEVGKFSYLKAVSVNNVGAFLDWGLPKDLFLPFREQKVDIVEGKHYAVYTYLDNNSMRIACSARVEKFLSKEECPYVRNEQVNLFLYSKTDLGYKAIINETHFGMIFQEEIFQNIELGQTVSGYIKLIREDGKIDLSLEKLGFTKISGHAEIVLNTLIDNDGFIAVTDKSSPKLIKDYFGLSKNNYKKAIGNLYKAKKVILERNGIRIV